MSCAAGALVEWQEPCARARELGRHGNRVGVHREVHQCPSCQRHVGGVAVIAVLLDGVLEVLMRELVLQLRGRGGDAVDQDRQVDGEVGANFVLELTSHAHAVGLVERLELRSQAMGRLEVSKLDGDAVVGDCVAEHVDGAACV